MTEQTLFYVGSLPVRGDLILSPMDGFSDLPFRSLCHDLGSAMSYTEFINVLDLRPGKDLPPAVEKKTRFLPQERPVVFQIFDSEPQRILEAALRLQELGPDIIDINMGCSDNSVSGRGAGAGLLRTPEKIAQIFSMLSSHLSIPVTGKIRLGWDEPNRNHTLVARSIEENGGALVAVHGRTKTQSYGGRADWDAIAEVVQSVSIPVLGNGDVRSVDDIERMKAYTGCAGVMIGRGAIGNPWIFSRLDRDQVSPHLLRQTMLRHLHSSLDFYGEQLGLVLFRKHASRYLAPIFPSAVERKRLLTCNHPEAFIELLDQLIEPSFEDTFLQLPVADPKLHHSI